MCTGQTASPTFTLAKTASGVSAVIRRDAVPAALTVEPVSIEDLFVLMIKGDAE